MGLSRAKGVFSFKMLDIFLNVLLVSMLFVLLGIILRFIGSLKMLPNWKKICLIWNRFQVVFYKLLCWTVLSILSNEMKFFIKKKKINKSMWF